MVSGLSQLSSFFIRHERKKEKVPETRSIGHATATPATARRSLAAAGLKQDEDPYGQTHLGSLLLQFAGEAKRSGDGEGDGEVEGRRCRRLQRGGGL